MYFLYNFECYIILFNFLTPFLLLIFYPYLVNIQEGHDLCLFYSLLQPQRPGQCLVYDRNAVTRC